MSFTQFQPKINDYLANFKPEDVFVFPSSSAQERLWFLTQLESHTSIYNEQVILELKGHLNKSVLEKGFNEIINRHEILRTFFSIQKNEVVQIIVPHLTIEFSIVDLTDKSKSEIQKIVKQQSIECLKYSFDLSQLPLIKPRLLKLNKDHYILLITLHHIIWDGWSVAVLIRELEILYRAFSHGNSSPLPPLDIQYADYTIWQKNHFQGKVLEDRLNYWKQQLKDIPSLLELPTDYPRPPVQTFNGDFETFIVNGELTKKLKQLSQKNESTLFMTLLTVWALLMSRYSYQEDIIIGSPIANRNKKEIESLIGLFLNTLVLRINCSDNPTFIELLQQVKQVCLAGYDHQDIAFEKLVETLQPDRNLSHTPLFQVMFILQNANNKQLQLPGLNINILEREHIFSKFDLTLSLTENKQELIGELEYNKDLFKASTIKRFISHFLILLESVVNAPNQKIQTLPILTEQERKQILIDWNQTEANYPKNSCLHQLFEKQVEKTPETIAIEFNNQKLTYSQLNQKANNLAFYLQQKGVKPNDLVTISMQRSIEMVIGLLAILKVGGTYIPIDPAYPSERINYILEHSQVEVILTQSSVWEDKPEKYTIIAVDNITLHPTSYTPPPHLTPNNLAYIIYTSGSTGKPKGVQISHQAIVNFLYSIAQQPGMNSHDTLLSVTTLSFDIAGLEIFLPLITGGKLLLVSRETAIDGVALSQKIDQCNPTIMQATPATWQMLIDARWKGKKDLKILCGGEALSKNLAKELLTKSSELWNMYGPTETTVWSMIEKIETEENITIGDPINNTQIYILDNHLQPVPIGIPGELYIGGDGLARGYVNRPDLTEERFINSPFKPEKRIYKTGDIGRYLPNGKVEYRGRSDYQVKIRGFRIELGEVESHLNQHSAIKNTVVVVKKNNKAINRLVGYYIVQEGEKIASEDLRSFLKKKLPDYMVPSAFVALDEFPLTPNGKINRNALPEVNEFLLSDSNKFIAPQTETQKTVASIWSEVLNLNSVSINSNFFELGGHSLLATQVISKVQDVFTIEIPIKHLFEKPTIETFSKAIEVYSQNRQFSQIVSIQPSERPSIIPLSFSQQRLWFLEQLEGENSAYIMSGALQLTGFLNLEVLENSINAIISRHEILRTTITTQEGNPTQVINYDTSKPYLKINILNVQPNDEIQNLIHKEVTKPFDLSQDSLIRVSLISLEKEESILIISMHHIISDAWSVGLFIQELSTYYNSYYQGDNLSLPPLKIQYADYAIWQRKWLESQSFNQQLSYWKNQLKNAPSYLNLPLDNPRSTKQSYEGNTLKFELSSQLTEQLKTLSYQEGITLFMTLLTAFDTLLYCYSGDEDICIGSPIANRQREETQNLIGFFVNTLVLRMDCSGNPTFRELLNRVKKMAIDAYSHQEVPFDKIVEALNIERNLSYNPLFQVWFVMDNDQTTNLNFPDLYWKMKEINYDSVRHDLSLRLSEKSEQMVGYFEYKTSLFNQNTIISMQEDFKLILNALVNNSNEYLTEIKAIIAQKKDERKDKQEQALLINMRQKLKRRQRR